MQEFEDIQSLWQSHTVEVKISSEEMLAQAKREVSSIRTKSLLNIGGMALSLIAFAALWLFFDFQSWTTHAGIAIIICSIAIYTFILYRGYRLISQSDFTAHPNDFLSQLKLYQLNRFSLYHKLYWFYTIALSIAIILFFFEVLSHFSFWKQFATVALTFGWILFCSTIFRKAVMNREKERIGLLIEKFERISAQFQENGH